MFGAGDQWLAHKGAGHGVIPLCEEVRAGGDVEIDRSSAQRAVALDSLTVYDRDLPNLPYRRLPVGKNFFDALARDILAVVEIPARRVVQQKIDTLPGPRRLLGERAGQIADFAIGRLDCVAV